MNVPFEAFILLVNEETQGYKSMPCTITLCDHRQRTVVLKDGTVIEDAEPMRIFANERIAAAFAVALNDIKSRELAANEWAELEANMKKECVNG